MAVMSLPPLTSPPPVYPRPSSHHLSPVADPRGPPPAPWLDANDDAHRDAEEAVAAMLGGYFDYSRARAELHLLAGEGHKRGPERVISASAMTWRPIRAGFGACNDRHTRSCLMQK